MFKFLFNSRRRRHNHTNNTPGRRGLTSSPIDHNDFVRAIPPEIQELSPGEFADVIAWCDPGYFTHRKTNIPHVLQYSESFSWGYSGAGPSDFALNILLHFTHGNEAFSRKHHIDFRDEIIAPLKNSESAVISMTMILEWIEGRKLTSPVLPEEAYLDVGRQAESEST